MLTTKTRACFAFAVLAANAGATHAQHQSIDAAVRQAVVDSFAAELRRYYVNPVVAESLIRALGARDAQTKLATATSSEALANRLNAIIHAVVRDDAHLAIRLRPTAKKDEQAEDPVASRLQFIREARAESFGIPEVRTLPGNIGYIRVGEFLYQAGMGGRPFALPTLTATMQLIAERDALILDLRENRGGHTTIPALLLGHLFDQQTLMGTSRPRDSSKAEPHFTAVPQAPVIFGGKKPIFVLTSDSTFSAGEGMAAALQANGRARVVGERTRGGANSGDFHSIGPGLAAFIPDEINVDAKGRTWESVGVTPDVPTRAVDAFDVAFRLALDSLAKAAPDAAQRRMLDSVIQTVRRAKPRGAR